MNYLGAALWFNLRVDYSFEFVRDPYVEARTSVNWKVQRESTAESTAIITFVRRTVWRSRPGKSACDIFKIRSMASHIRSATSQKNIVLCWIINVSTTRCASPPDTKGHGLYHVQYLPSQLSHGCVCKCLQSVTNLVLEFWMIMVSFLSI